MKRILFLLLFLMCVRMGAPFPLHGNVSEHPRDMSFEQLEFSPSKGEKITLDNGIVLYVLEDHELPLFNLSALIRTGAIYEPQEKIGLAELTGKVMRTGGTVSMSADKINDQLEYVAGSVETSIGRESGSASLSVMKKDIDLGLKIFADILMNPGFEQEKVDLAKEQKIEAIRRRNDNPNKIAFREFRRQLYKDNPRGRIPTYRSIKAITRQDLMEFHEKFFRPENIMFAVSGDFKKDHIIRKISKAFQGWEKKPAEVPKVPPPGLSMERSIHYAFKNIPQSTIVLGHLAVKKTDPDYYPFKVLNFILGEGGFNSRLMSEIRSNRGLAYSVGSFFRGDVDYGVFAVICMTKSSTTYEAISLIEEIITETKENGITEEELAWAKESIINKFIFSFTSPASVVNHQMRLEYDSLPHDYLQRYKENISLVTLKDVQRVAMKYLHPDKSVLMVVGKDEDFDNPLSHLGQVNEIKLTQD